MTDRKPPKRRRLAYEILGLIGVSALFAAILFLILSGTGAVIVEGYCFRNDLIMTELDWLAADRWIFSMSGLLSAVAFSLLFLVLLGDHMAYIRTITAGIDELRRGPTVLALPLEGNNELTALAEAVNDLSAAQQRLREKERAMAQEKEQFLRTLSHDIRTPLTSILAYSEYLSGDAQLSPEEQRMHLQLLRKKAEQIRDLTALLLDGDRRSPEYFADARLLMEQLAAEFEEVLEDRFDIQTDLSGCPAFSGSFDAQELRRIFDNLSSNVEKYADRSQPVFLSICVTQEGLHIRQSNGICADAGPKDSYRLGLNSIRRMAQSYGGRVTVQKDEKRFAIEISLCELL